MDQVIERARGFNRFYTRIIGVLDDSYLGSGLVLPEARVIYELSQRNMPTASEIGEALGMDAGYLSRILKRLEAKGLVTRAQAKEDRRQSLLALTPKGREMHGGLDRGARRVMAAALGNLDDGRQQRLTGAMDEIEGLLGDALVEAPVILRQPKPGDMGWIIERHAVSYTREQGWGETFETHVAELIVQLRTNFDPDRERCWIAERAGRRLGCVFVAKEDETTARLRLLFLEPEARGLGLGRRLVDETLRFSREAGYSHMILWTHAMLTPARKIYADVGFEKIAEYSHTEFGPEVLSETWKMAL